MSAKSSAMQLSANAKHAFRFVLLMSFVSLFADMVYEGGRSAAGPLLATLGATGMQVGFIAGFGELLGYGMRTLAGSLADRTGKYWIPTFLGYTINLLCVPAIALAGSWPLAAGLLIGERIGRGIRKPTASAMLAHAGSELGHGWVFGFREAMDQLGATVGALSIAAVLFFHGGFPLAYGLLIIPAVLSLVVLTMARHEYPHPHELETTRTLDPAGFAASYWRLVIAGSCIAAGFADFALLSFHLSKAGILPNAVIPLAYAVAMLAGAAMAPYIGRLYDRFGMRVAIVAFALAAAYAPLAFLGNATLAWIGIGLWGVGMGAQEALLASIIARTAPAARRATALGVFDGIFGVAWFLGSALMGILYDYSLIWLVVFALLLQFAALPFFASAERAAATS